MLSAPLCAFLFHWKQGRRYQVPLCCRLHFCIDSAAGRVVSVVRWRQIARWETPLLHDQ
jgi:hypothetical protein